MKFTIDLNHFIEEIEEEEITNISLHTYSITVDPDSSHSLFFNLLDKLLGHRDKERKFQEKLRLEFISKIKTLSDEEKEFISVSKEVFGISRWTPTCPASLEDLRFEVSYREIYDAGDGECIDKEKRTHYFLRTWNPPSRKVSLPWRD